MTPILATLSEWHLILALIIIFLLFGGKKLPELARGIGEALKEFKKSQREAPKDDTHPQAPSAPAATPPPPATTTPPQKPDHPPAG